MVIWQNNLAVQRPLQAVYLSSVYSTLWNPLSVQTIASSSSSFYDPDNQRERMPINSSSKILQSTIIVKLHPLNNIQSYKIVIKYNLDLMDQNMNQYTDWIPNIKQFSFL